jgi:hypothetical protein
MFLIAVSTFPFKRMRLSQSQLETIIIDGEGFNVLIIFDPKKMSLSKTNSRLLLVEPLLPLEDAQVVDILDFQFKFQTLMRNLILSAIGVNLTDKRVNIVFSLLKSQILYYHISENKNSIYCSTHIKLLMEVGVKIQEEHKAIAEYFIFGSMLPPLTLYKDINKTFNGQSLEIHYKNNTLRLQTSVFPLPLEKKQTKNEDEIFEKVIEILTNSLIKLKSYPNKTAMSFSGGIDTSILTKILKNEKVESHYYSLSFPFEDSDKSMEKQYATTAGQALQLNHTHLLVDRKEYLHTLIDLIAEGEEPLSLFLQVPLFCAMLKRLQTEETILYGKAADSLFGFPFHNMILYFKEHFPGNLRILMRTKSVKFIKRCLAISGLKYPLIKNVVRFILRVQHKDPKKLESMAKTKTDTKLGDPKHMFWQFFFRGDEEWATHRFNTSIEEIISRQEQALTSYKNYSILDLYSICRVLGRMALNGSTLIKFGEKHGKNIFFPFLNDLLVYYSFQIPWKIKLKTPKYILRKVAKKIGVPEFIITRPKIGFPTRAEDWALPGKFMECFVPICKNYFTEKEIRGMQSKKTYKYATFWFMINYSIWKQIFIENKSPEILKKQLNKNLEKN